MQQTISEKRRHKIFLDNFTPFLKYFSRIFYFKLAHLMAKLKTILDNIFSHTHIYIRLYTRLCVCIMFIWRLPSFYVSSLWMAFLTSHPWPLGWLLSLVADLHSLRQRQEKKLVTFSVLLPTDWTYYPITIEFRVDGMTNKIRIYTQLDYDDKYLYHKHHSLNLHD